LRISRIAAKKSANKVNRINLNGVTYGFQGIHAAAIAPLGLHRKHVERTLARVRYGGSESWNDRQRLAENGDIAHCDGLSSQECVLRASLVAR
jgi:hypothetical protein